MTTFKHRKMKYIQFLQVVIIAGIIGSASSGKAATDSSSNYSSGHKSIESRLLAVRETIQQHAKPEHGSSDPIDGILDHEQTGHNHDLISQYYWPNWGNWANWNNWRNWGNWGNW